jgi:CubicO group peptidase (beta-lactamase class C family)
MRWISLFGALMLNACASVAPITPDDPGVEVLVAFDQRGVQGSALRGTADPATGRAATFDDPVRVASISKLVVAIGVLQLVEQGRLQLDGDVSGTLGYPLRNPAFPGAPITLRQLLSHTAGVRDHDDQYAISLDGSVRAVMADPRSWDPRHAPNAGWFTYSNMNFPIIASLVERATGERFDRWMHGHVLAPMRLDACFNWPSCSDAAVARAVVLTQGGSPVKDELGGRRPACPVSPATDGSCDLGRWVAGRNGALFAPQGGLRISAYGLARVGRMLLGNGTLDGVTILSPASVELLLAPQWRFNGHNGDTDRGFYCSYGLASHQIAAKTRGCQDDPAGDGIARVGQAGEAYGLRSGLWIDRATGTGIAYYRTGLAADATPGRTAFRAAEEASFRRALRLARSPKAR